MPISIGDTVPTVKDKNGDEIAIAPNSSVAVGDTVITLKDKNGDDIIIKNGPIVVGDTVICAKDQNGDDVIIKPGGCEPIGLQLVGYSISNGKNWTYKLSEDITYQNWLHFDEINLKIDFFIPPCPGTPVIPNMYPCGAVWVGFGTPDTYGVVGAGGKWLWRLIPNPYATLGFGYDMDLRTGKGAGGQIGNLTNNRWCIPNILYYYAMGSRFGGFINENIRYIRIHLRNSISLYFGDGNPRSNIVDIRMCKGHVCEGDPSPLNACKDADWCRK